MSAMVLGVLVVLWAVVLVPMWLKRHDKLNELAAVDRFAGAMRVLARRPGKNAAGRYVMVPARSAASRAPHVSGSSREVRSAADLHRRRAESAAAPRTSSQTAAAYERAVRAGAGQARSSSRIARRRQLVIAMAVSLVVTIALALLGGGIFVALQVFVDVLVLAGLLHLRSQAVADQAAARRARRRAAAPVADEPMLQERSEEIFVAARTRTASLPPVYEEPAPVYTAPVAEPAVAQQISRPARVVAPAVARPRTHVAAEAARVARPARTVDLTQPGRWTEQQAASHLDEAWMVSPSAPGVTAELIAEQRAEAAALADPGLVDDGELEYLLGRAVGE